MYLNVKMGFLEFESRWSMDDAPALQAPCIDGNQWRREWRRPRLHIAHCTLLILEIGEMTRPLRSSLLSAVGVAASYHLRAVPSPLRSPYGS